MGALHDDGPRTMGGGRNEERARVGRAQTSGFQKGMHMLCINIDGGSYAELMQLSHGYVSARPMRSAFTTRFDPILLTHIPIYAAVHRPHKLIKRFHWALLSLRTGCERSSHTIDVDCDTALWHMPNDTSANGVCDKRGAARGAIADGDLDWMVNICCRFIEWQCEIAQRNRALKVCNLYSDISIIDADVGDSVGPSVSVSVGVGMRVPANEDNSSSTKAEWIGCRISDSINWLREKYFPANRSPNLFSCNQSHENHSTANALRERQQNCIASECFSDAGTSATVGSISKIAASIEMDVARRRQVTLLHSDHLFGLAFSLAFCSHTKCSASHCVVSRLTEISIRCTMCGAFWNRKRNLTNQCLCNEVILMQVEFFWGNRPLRAPFAETYAASAFAYVCTSAYLYSNRTENRLGERFIVMRMHFSSPVFTFDWVCVRDRVCIQITDSLWELQSECINCVQRTSLTG